MVMREKMERGGGGFNLYDHKILLEVQRTPCLPFPAIHDAAEAHRVSLWGSQGESSHCLAP